MLVTTPQSRLTPCQLPGRGAFWGATTNQKLSPRAGKVAWRSHDERGTAQSCQVPRDVPPLSFAYAASSPINGGAFWVQYKHGVQCRTPSRSDRFNGVMGVAREPKGRNRNLPWPPDKKDYKIVCSAFCLFYSFRLLVSLASTSLDREAFGAFYQLFLAVPQVAPICRQIIAFISFS